MTKKHKTGKPPVSPLKVEMSFDEFMKKAVRVPNPRTLKVPKGAASV